MTQTPVVEAVQDIPERIAARALLAKAAAENVPSPCISVCRMSASSGLCEGCYRTLDEIRSWSKADDEVRRTIWSRIERRLAESAP